MQHAGYLAAACEHLVAACGIQFPDLGSNLGPMHREHGVLATGPPVKSQCIVFITITPMAAKTTRMVGNGFLKN